MKISKMLALSSVGLALCCVAYLGACGNGSSVPSIQDLLSKTNQLNKCIDLNAKDDVLTAAESEALSSGCSDSDRSTYGKVLDCAISVACNNSTDKCGSLSSVTSSLSASCQTALAALNP